MAEMDIYMRRRLVALGGLVLFFILFVLLVKSCGGDEEPEQVTSSSGATGATGAAGAALSVDDYIAQADSEICEPANLSVSELDPTDTNATQQEYAITRDELKQLESLQLAEPDRRIATFINDLSNVVDALREKADALKAGDTATADQAQLAIDEAEVEARASGEDAGFDACGQFLDAGEDPGNRANNADATTDAGTAAPPTDTGAVTPPTDTGTAPPATDTGTETPPADTGGDTGGGITP